MISKSKSILIFQDIFGETMKKDGFFLKDGSAYYSIDCENKWLKKLSLNLWDNGRLFRIFVTISLFSDEYWQPFQKNDDNVHDISKMAPSPNPLWKGFFKQEKTFFTLEPFMPTVESITNAYDHYITNIKRYFIPCRTYPDIIKCNAILQAMGTPVKANELDRLNAYLYIGDTLNATLAAYRYRNDLMRDMESLVDLLGKGDGTDALKAYYKNSLMDLQKQLDDIIKAIHLLEKNEIEQLLEPINARIEERKKEAIDFCTRN